MTTEKAVEKVKRVKNIYAYESDYEALDMAIYALEERQNILDTALPYVELREKIHEILREFFMREVDCIKGGEFDFEFMETQTDALLRLIQNQGGIYGKEKEKCNRNQKLKVELF